MADDNTKTQEDLTTKNEAEAASGAQVNEMDKTSDITRETAKAGEDAEKVAAQTTQTAGEAGTDIVSRIADKNVGDHYAQRFANAPENPKLAPGLDPDLPEDKLEKLVLSDSDHPDPLNPKVTFVHPEMVGDYIRAGWRRPD